MRLSPNINFAKIVSLKDYIRNRAPSIVDHMVLNRGRIVPAITVAIAVAVSYHYHYEVAD